MHLFNSLHIMCTVTELLVIVKANNMVAKWLCLLLSHPIIYTKGLQRIKLSPSQLCEMSLGDASNP